MNQRNLSWDVEDILWMTLPILQLYSFGFDFWPPWITLLHAHGYIFFRNGNTTSSSSSSVSNFVSGPAEPVDTRKTTNNDSSTNFNNGSIQQQHQHPSNCKTHVTTRPRDTVRDNGMVTSIILPTSLLSAMAYSNSYWTNHAKLVCMLCFSYQIDSPNTKANDRTNNGIQATTGHPSGAFAQISHFLLIGLGMVGMILLDSQLWQSFDVGCIVLTIVYMTTQRMETVKRSLMDVVTVGEYQIICWFSTIVITEWVVWCLRLHLSQSSDPDSMNRNLTMLSLTDEYLGWFVSLSGAVGCAVSCYAISKLYSMRDSAKVNGDGRISYIILRYFQKSNIEARTRRHEPKGGDDCHYLYWVRLLAHAIGPLLVVELALKLLYQHNIGIVRDHENKEHDQSNSDWMVVKWNSEGHNFFDTTEKYVPYWALFLFRFLVSHESPSSESLGAVTFTATNGTAALDKHNDYPRYYGLLYWTFALILLGLPTVLWVLGNDRFDDDNTRVKSTRANLFPNSHNNSTSSENFVSQKHSTSSFCYVVIRRKWFHLVAVVLFGPVTWYMPQLMSLGYAIATCLLVVVECCDLRMKFEGLDRFYQSFLDDTKDITANSTQRNGVDSQIQDRRDGCRQRQPLVVSHIFLVVGCAAPLWIANCCYCAPSTSHTTAETSIINNPDTIGLRYLQLAGVLCLGVGDAMGACVGKLYGRRRWGKNHRTIEGSLAMLSTMIFAVVVVIIVHGGVEAGPWARLGGKMNVGAKSTKGGLNILWVTVLVSMTNATLLEAFTLQMDNLVLPLAFSTLTLTLQQASRG